MKYVQSVFIYDVANVENCQVHVIEIGHRHLNDRPALQIFMLRFTYQPADHSITVADLRSYT